MAHSRTMTQAVVMVAVVMLVMSHGIRSTASSASPYRHLVTSDTIPEYTRGKDAYKWVLSPMGRRNGIAFLGSNTRLRVAMQKLKSGQPFHITTVGASVTAGIGLTDGHSWPQYLFNYLQDHYGINVLGINGAVGATRTTYLNVCHNLHVLPTSDLIIVEYSFTSQCQQGWCDEERVTERMLRKLLKYPNKPAIIFVHAILFNTKSPASNWNWGGEASYNELSTYYQIPSVSLRACCWQLFMGNFPGFNTTHRKPSGQANVSFWHDGVQLDGLTGARVFSELIIHLLLHTLDSLEAEPISAPEQEVATAALPEPLIPGNYEHPTDRCFMNANFLGLVKHNVSFRWIDESRDTRFGKLGMLATTAGAVLEIGLDTRASSPETTQNMRSTLLLLAYLKSHRHMGRATVECIHGCACNATQIDGHMQQHSMMQFQEIKVSQAQLCEIRVTVESETSSGGYKVKILGVVVSEESERHYLWQGDGQTANTVQQTL